MKSRSFAPVQPLSAPLIYQLSSGSLGNPLLSLPLKSGFGSALSCREPLLLFSQSTLLLQAQRLYVIPSRDAFALPNLPPEKSLQLLSGKEPSP